MTSLVSLSREDFTVLVMLYAAGIDAKFTKEEEELIKSETSPPSYMKMKALYSKYSDKGVIDLILSYANRYLSTEKEQAALMESIRKVFTADNRYSQFEHAVMGIFQKMLK